MRTVPPGLAARLASGVTTLAHAWTLRRRDGVVLGFTDHDRDLILGGIVHSAATGLEASEAESQLGLAVGGAEVAGALVSAALTEADLAAGRWDDARVESWLVDWRSPEDRILLDVAAIGDVRRSDHAFVAELRSLADRMDSPTGRLYGAGCDADLGDARCRIDLSSPAWSAQATVTATDGRSWVASTGLAAAAEGLFTGGRFTVADGPDAGLAVEVKAHWREPARGLAHLALWQPLPEPLAVGAAFSLTAGCDKRFATCRDRFGNAANFRGFPHMPGTDFILRVAKSGEPMDGGSLFR